VKAIDLSEDPLVGAISTVIKRYGEMQPIDEDYVLECLAYVYACVQRVNVNGGVHPTKLN
jgi:hypothetical protein